LLLERRHKYAIKKTSSKLYVKASRYTPTGRADSKCQLGFSRGCSVAIAKSALMSCITAYKLSRIESNSNHLCQER